MYGVILTTKQQSLVSQLLGVGCVIVDPTTKEGYLVRGSRVTKYVLMVVTRKGHVDPFIHKGSGRPGVLRWTEIITLLNSKNITWKKPSSKMYGADTHATLPTHEGEQHGISLCKEYLLRIPFSTRFYNVELLVGFKGSSHATKDQKAADWHGRLGLWESIK